MKKYKYILEVSNEEKNVIMRLLNDERSRKLKSGNTADAALLDVVMEKIALAEPKKVGGLFK